MLDWTDPSHPIEIAYFDRGPIDPTRLVSAGSWSAYWYNGLVISSEVMRGLDVLELIPSGLLSSNEIEAANTVRLEYLNPQEQQRFVWPPSFPLARAYLDQLERGAGLATERIASVRGELQRAERLSGTGRHDALSALAEHLAGEARSVVDPSRVEALTTAVDGSRGRALTVRRADAPSQHLRVEHRTTQRSLAPDVREPVRLVQRHRPPIVLMDLERDLAALQRPRLFFHRAQQLTSDSLTAMTVEDAQVVDIDQRACVERREPDEARRQPDRPRLPPVRIVREQQHLRGMCPETFDQPSQHIVGQRRIGPHLVRTVGGRQREDVVPVIRPVEVGLDDPGPWCHVPTLSPTSALRERT